MNEYSPDVFKTSLMGENMVVMCGTSGKKFMFSIENKHVTSWWPRPVKKVLISPTLLTNPSTKEPSKPPSSLPELLKPEALKHYLGIMDSMAHEHIDIDWAPHVEVKVFPLSKKYNFSLFMNLKDPEHVARVSHPFNLMVGLLCRF